MPRDYVTKSEYRHCQQKIVPIPEWLQEESFRFSAFFPDSQREITSRGKIQSNSIQQRLLNHLNYFLEILQVHYLVQLRSFPSKSMSPLIEGRYTLDHGFIPVHQIHFCSKFSSADKINLQGFIEQIINYFSK